MLTDIFKGIQTKDCYLADCPLCAESYSLQIYDGDIWRCVSCNQSGDLDTMKQLMGSDFLLSVDQLGKQKPPEGLIVVGEYVNTSKESNTATGFNPIDRMLGGLSSGMLTVMTGKRGEGKSTFAGQMALNLVNEGKSVCFYSGELNASTFQTWIINQAAGPRFIDQYTDKFGETRYRVDTWAEPRILTWLGKKLILYDNNIVKASERNSIIERFRIAHQFFGCDVFFVDNLMTARIPIDQERDFYRAQSNFVRDLTEFAINSNSHVVLIAHPRKNIGSDLNDAIAGTADITNLASNVMAVSKKENAEWDAEVEITKNRQYGSLGAIRFNFEKSTRRFVLTSGKQIDKYGWEDEV